MKAYISSVKMMDRKTGITYKHVIATKYKNRADCIASIIAIFSSGYELTGIKSSRLQTPFIDMVETPETKFSLN
jgi:hypothetical protein